MSHNSNVFDQASTLLHQKEFQAALALLEKEVSHQSTPELLALYGTTLCYFQRESEAAALLDQLEGTGFGAELAQLLANYADSRQRIAEKLGRSDAFASGLQERTNPFSPDRTKFRGTKLSAVLIVKNEAKHLARCLESLQGKVDEIVVVDTGSTDETATIARSFGAVIGEFSWCNDFSAARNASLELATGDWALWIDADEAITPESWPKIWEAITRPQFGGYFIRIVNFTNESETSEYTHAPVRLFQARPEIRFSGSIHEQICHGIDALGLPTAHLDGATILHYGYKPSEIIEKGKLARTIQMLQDQIIREPNDSFHWFNLANVLSVARRYLESAEAARKALDLMEPSNSFASLTYHLLASGLNATDQPQAAIDAAIEAKAAGCFTILNQFELAHSYLLDRDFHSALAAIDACSQMPWPEDMTGDRGIVTHKGKLLKGQILCELDRLDEASECIEYALRVDPEFGLASHAKGVILEKSGRLEEAESWFKRSLTDPSVALQALKGLARVSFELGQFDEARKYAFAALEAKPGDKQAWVVWAQSLENLNDPREMSRAYEDYTSKHGDHADVLTNWGRALVAQNELESAAEKYLLATEVDPTCFNAWLNLGDLLFAVGNFTEAATCFQNALKIEPRQPEAWFCLGNCCGQLGVWPAAISAYEQTLQLDSEHSAAKHNWQIAQDELAAA